ncbi:glycoside hydrolase family 3 C-terminal domain-containing protein [Anaerocolumna xylanovorans]|uniref:Beta-glucosidase n=1 Tax=Anaerocolumna xylanovorans DSM 12503 TaxID=1121345 RepID=A0A1M7YIN7_9FIRM|nr:glycoside hydrolase family 3 C-terminal domain-containing protein [Anaerocolumna xylanovorans]SHO52472.1 beta-glucosidase [Anaerocolumna xylanovorans DSM 12503]
MEKGNHTLKSVLPKAKELVEQMSLEEKASLCSGKDFWHTKGIERLGIKSMMVTDGPHGLRKQAGDSDHLGINNSVLATCFPTAVATACSFDRDLLYEMGMALGEECVQEEVAVILGPGANIKRSPLCGRNFEYFSEDPLLTGEMAAALISGIQSNNIGASLKHYLANNQEKARLVSNSVIDERALREIYLTGFEIAIKKAQPWTLMCSYNKINDIYASGHKRLMTDIPRGEWGFGGAIMTDWGAMNDRAEGILAGLDLEMPAFDGASDQLIVDMVRAGKLEEKLVDLCAVRMTAIALQAEKTQTTPYDAEVHNELARRIARESAALLKLGNALPADKHKKIALIGEFAKVPRYQGAGSSRISPIRITSVTDAFDAENISYSFAPGYSSASDEPNEALITEAIGVAKEADVIFAFVGLPDSYESEGFDRTHLNMPKAHTGLIEELIATGKKIVAVISAGGVVNIPWRDKVDSILLMNLSGQNSGYAAYDLLFGDYCPCGKLAETYPLSLTDTPSITHFGTGGNIEYRESIYVGYRYYDKAQKQVMYPFGHGLSYTAFTYSGLKLSAKKMGDRDTLQVELVVTNTGKWAGKEIVQLYISAPESTVFKPVRELRDFAKVELQIDESKTVTFTLERRAFAYYNVNVKDWFVESGDYRIEIGASSRDIRLHDTVTIESRQEGAIPDYRAAAPGYYSLLQPGTYDIPKEQFEAVLGRKVPQERSPRPFTLNSTLGEIRVHWIGRMMNKQIEKSTMQMFEGGEGNSSDIVKMIQEMAVDMPLRQLGMLSQGKLSVRMVKGLIDIMNGHILKGIRGLMKK